jgi:hypothetical protein
MRVTSRPTGERVGQERLEVGPGGAARQVPRRRRRCRPAHGDEVGGDGAGRAVLGVQVLLEVAEERVGPRGSMNREVKQGKRSPSGTQSLERVPRQRN